MEHLPKLEQSLSVIVVRDSEIQVKTGMVTEIDGENLTLHLFDPLEEPLLNVTGKLVTLIYGTEDQIFRLKSRVADVLANDKLVVSVAGKAKKRERREFLRVEATLPIRLCQLSATDEDAALVEAESIGVASTSWEQREVNISGSGVRFASAEPATIGDFYLVELALPYQGKDPISVVGQVARILDGEGDEKLVAVHFIDIQVSAQDMIINYVFKRQYELIEEKWKTPDQ